MENQKMPKTEKEWERKLKPEEYAVLRQGGTEAPFSGEYVYTKDKGMYRCRACGNEIFSSETKFESGTGWPSFYDAIPGAVKLQEDKSLGMVRTEILCAKCGSHLGHVFDDGPQPTGKRYCINCVSLNLEKSAQE
ncbi:peptide-methionine (R)-S-oxide reductase [candidate division WWE3 bacterium RBG_19FT_COMBO_53_11]|uniref:peptide-methionine (R)-S-oxide reductase n=1 Tax=candidate division WWE3 bacterium RBG_19FT_COMBO_53_11 TaxID=1802613 RepID=A0A1F4UIY4_UNCKA|nr:MAG: peptide-methionine (R)-S-oxide reductase [candidate division WWE3 bacterium RBG_16_52_45]OGC44879.1 MAG: peptide-methionine (R)-S-oxide reductase [candidate division WWE3 bacterium RBG_19FT_COMBO_53_11]